MTEAGGVGNAGAGTKGVVRFVVAESGNIALSSTVETHVLFYASTVLLGGQYWSEGAKVHGTWVGAGAQGLDRDDGCLGGRCTGSWASFSFCLLCTNAIVKALEVGGEFPIDF